MWEEPSISGTKGSGTVFFSGCTLGCVFCQNYEISRQGAGKEVTEEKLRDIFLRLQEQGAHNINLVTATHYLPSVVKALESARPRLSIPIVYNCGGYERPEIIQALEPYVDIWLPDLKYYDSRLSSSYSGAKDYFTWAKAAIEQMIRQTKSPVFDDKGLMKSGVIIRHMILPGAREDSIRLLQWIKDSLPDRQYCISLLSQYTPFYLVKDTSLYPQLKRRITSYEYEKVVEFALKLDLSDGYMQEKSSAKEEYTPPFNLEGV
jgi:putative pyruvate formate lyase activating enzyme